MINVLSKLVTFVKSTDKPVSIVFIGHHSIEYNIDKLSVVIENGYMNFFFKDILIETIERRDGRELEVELDRALKKRSEQMKKEFLEDKS